MTRTEQAVVRAAMRRFRQLEKKYPVEFAQINAGGNPTGMHAYAIALNRACHAHAKATKLKGKRK